MQPRSRPRQGRDRLRDGVARALCLAACASLAALAPSATAAQPSVYVIDHVADGDTVALRNGQRVRLVQIDTPEVYFGTECYGPQASATTKRLLAPGTRVRLFVEPDSVDQYGRLLRYVVRATDGLNVNVQLVRVGTAAPYFYLSRRGRYAAILERLALRARAKKLGLWERCPHTPYDPEQWGQRGVVRPCLVVLREGRVGEVDDIDVEGDGA